MHLLTTSKKFRADFFPGEDVSAIFGEGELIECVVREKASFPELRNADGTISRPEFSRYFVELKTTGDEALLDNAHLKRKRNVFTKQNVRAFLKNCLRREAWIGAPWLVREQLAQTYRLPMTIPNHLTQEAKVAQAQARQQQQQMQKDSPNAKSKKTKFTGPPPFSVDRILGAPVQVDEQSDHAKHPADDLDIEPSSSGHVKPRPAVMASFDRSSNLDRDAIADPVGAMLEIWNALNVHWDVYGLESFTFDDFVDAVKYSSPNIPCELFDELHCALLQTLVTTDGHVQVTLPDIDSDSDGQTADDTSVPQTPLEPNFVPKKSRLSQVQTVDDDHPLLQNEGPHKVNNNAGEMLAGRPWIARLQERDFAEGGWQIILVGLLHQLALDETWKSRCAPVLAHVAPVQLRPTQDTAVTQYNSLDVSHRISVLQMLVSLSMTSLTLRKHLEDRGEEMTAIRKQKTEMQRTRKDHIKDLARLELDRAESNPDAFAEDDSTIDTPQLTNGHHDASLSVINGNHSSDEDEDVPRHLRRSNNARKRKRDDEIIKRENERLARLSMQKENNDKIKKYKKILKDIEKAKDKVTACETAIETFDEQLREMHVMRMRSLGRDRFFNRYWWFERVGLALDGVRERGSKKAKLENFEHPGYANGRVWVQGPTEVERRGFIDMSPEDSRLYAARHGMTASERRTAEEGPMHLSADQWGYYENADDLDALIGWLDERGRREKDLRKELLEWREDIVTQMEVRKQHLASHDKDEASTNGKEESDDDHAGPKTRVSTRNKTYLDNDDVDKRYPCLRWRNTRAGTKTGRHCFIKAESAASRKKGAAAAAAASTLQSKKQVNGHNKPAAGGRGVARVVSSGSGRGERTAAREAGDRISVALREEMKNANGAAAGTRRGMRSSR